VIRAAALVPPLALFGARLHLLLMRCCRATLRCSSLPANAGKEEIEVIRVQMGLNKRCRNNDAVSL
jgi:hypothetical protein